MEERITVAELIEILSNCQQDAIVVMSRDEEGNSYAPLYEVNGGVVNYGYKDNEIGLQRYDEDAECAGYTSEDLIEDSELCVVLYP